MNPQQGNLLYTSLPHPDKFFFEKCYKKEGFVRALRRTAIGKDVRIRALKRNLKQIHALDTAARLIKKALKE